MSLLALIPPHAAATAARMPLRLALTFSVALLSACASRPVVPREDVPVAAEPLPPEIKPLTLEQEEQVAGVPN